MKVYFIISGLLRTFYETLFPYICSLDNKIEYEFLLIIGDNTSDKKYISDELYQEILKHKKCSLFIIDKTELPNIDHFNEREKNTIYQWYRIATCLQFLKNKSIAKDSIIIRIRPDIKIYTPIDDFINILKLSDKKDTLFIPKGNDIFNESFQKYAVNTINDQIAFGNLDSMLIYCSLYNNIDFSRLTSPIISESILANYLEEQSIKIERFQLDYNVCLSDCKIIAISGDSGVGKTTLVNSIIKIFPDDSNIILETDRYHKWERNSPQWSLFTHLNPSANFLEKMIDDTYLLKLGKEISQIDYDHSSGKFTDKKIINSKNFIFLCGLHTLYKEEIRSNSDIKIFIDTEYELKRRWKIERDMKNRGYSFQLAESLFNKRYDDYQKYIEPQKEFADIIIYYYMKSSLLLDIYIKTSCNTDKIHSLMVNYSTNITINDYTIYSIKENIVKEDIQSLPSNIDINNIDDSYLGVIQSLIYNLCFNDINTR